MEITPQLIENFLSDRCSPQEADFLVQYFRQFPDELEKFLGEKEWTLMKSPLPLNEEKDQKAWKEIKQHTIATRRIHWQKRQWAAAASVLFAITSWWIIGKQLKKELPPISSVRTAPVEQLSLTNAGKKDTLITLEDKSEVILTPGSTVRFSRPFVGKQRRLQLDGRAFFQVSRNTEKPFIVVTEGLTTTVLGTSFWIESYHLSKALLVQLKTGKVCIQQENNVDFKPVYLLPGQQLLVNRNNLQATISRTNKNSDPVARSANGKKQKKTSENFLVFDQLPLSIVFERLETCYHIPIQFEEEPLRNKKFSGKYPAGENIEAILKTITLLNDLKLEKNTPGYIIH